MIINNIKNPYVGKKCKKGSAIMLEKTSAGFCLSTWDDDGPCCRISEYASTEKGAELLVPNRVSEETVFCNGGCGCGIQLAKEESSSDSADSKDSSEEEEYVYYAIEEVSVKLVAVSKKVIEEERERHPSKLSKHDDSSIAYNIVYASWRDEEIVLEADDHSGVDFKEITANSEYAYLLEHYKDSAFVIDELKKKS